VSARARSPDQRQVGALGAHAGKPHQLAPGFVARKPLEGLQVDAPHGGLGQCFDVAIPVAELGRADRLQRRDSKFAGGPARHGRRARRRRTDRGTRPRGLHASRTRAGRRCSGRGRRRRGRRTSRTHAFPSRRSCTRRWRKRGDRRRHRVERPEVVVQAQVPRHPFADLVHLRGGERLTMGDRQLDLGRVDRSAGLDVDLPPGPPEDRRTISTSVWASRTSGAMT
jgi:hypothetical protein